MASNKHWEKINKSLSSIAISLIGLNTLLIFFIAVIFLKEKMDLTKGIGIGLTVLGSYLLLK